MPTRKAQAPSGAPIPSGAPPKPAKGSTLARRRRRRRLAHLIVCTNMQLVRERDGKCRFPHCRCSDSSLTRMEVAHRSGFHRGMGGNPTGDRSTTPLMLYLCHFRHQDASFSLHRGTLRWTPVDDAVGADGCIVWERKDAWNRWVPFAQERTPHGEWDMTGDARRWVEDLSIDDLGIVWPHALRNSR